MIFPSKDRACFNCGSEKTYIDKRGCASWHNHNGKWCCLKCHNKLVTNPKWHPINNPITNPRRITFKNKQCIVTNECPRTGTCSVCHKKIGDKYVNCHDETRILEYTIIHHKKYDHNNKLDHTIELCPQCHKKEHLRLKKKGIKLE